MIFRALSVAAALVLCSVPASAQVKLEFRDGRVTLSAQNAPIRTILAEWARLGGTKIINGERVTGPPVTLELTSVPERQAIDVLLRGTAGYIVGARTAATTGASAFDRILIVATSTPPAGVRQPVTTARGRVQQPPPQIEPQPAPDVDLEENPPDDIPPPDPDGRPTPASIRQAAEAARRRLQERRGQLLSAERVIEDTADNNDQPAPVPAPGANPFGVVPSFATPGVLAPTPQQQPPPATRGRQPDPD